MAPLREDLINSAVTFLKDPQVASSPLTKKLEFLESKELTNEEIQEALKRAGGDESATTTTTTVPSNNTQYTQPRNTAPVVPPPIPYATYSAPPPVPQRDWRDYFVMATVSVGVTYGLYELARRYVLPLIVPPTPASLEADKQALDAEFSKAQAILDQLQRDTQELKDSEKQRTEKVDEALEELEAVMSGVKSQVEKRDEDMKLIKSQIENLKNEIPSAIKRNEDASKQALSDLVQELKSLKQLVSARIKATGVSPSIPPPPMPSSYTSSSVSTNATSNKTGNSLSNSSSGSSTPYPNMNPPPSVFYSNSTTPITSPPLDAQGPVPSTTSSNSNSASAASIPPSTSFPAPPKRGIPAWQLAAKGGSTGSTSSAATTPAAAASSTTPTASASSTTTTPTTTETSTSTQSSS